MVDLANGATAPGQTVTEEPRVPTTLGSLLADPRFGLRPVAALDEQSLARPVPWAHSSDLPDPTPWLEPGQLLLTNGAQVAAEPDPVQVRGYVERLVASGLGGLAFATRVVHDTVPAELARCCAEAGLPLLEVADRTPFIAIIRHVADTLAAEQRERLERSLTAHRALARAALRPDGLAEVLHELQRRLDCWAALYDAAGDRVPVRGVRVLPAGVEAEVSAAVRQMLAQGHRAGLRLAAADGAVTLQTIGQRDRLGGVLAVGTAVPLDADGTDLVASVIGIASISVEQSRVVDDARQELRSGVLELLLAGAVGTARATAARVGDDLPAAPVRVAVVGRASVPDAVRSGLSGSDRRRSRWFVAQRGEDLVVVLADRDVERVEGVLVKHDVAAGLSAPGPWTALPDLLAEARRAADRGGPGVTRFESLLGDGMLGLVAAGGGHVLARRLLAQLADHPDREVLLGSVRTWLRHGCAWDPAARELGVHRHTLRNRTAVVERTLGLDLSSFAGRAELWLALQLVPG